MLHSQFTVDAQNRLAASLGCVEGELGHGIASDLDRR